MINRLICKLRILKYRLLWDRVSVNGSAHLYQPLVCKGEGEIIIGTDVHLGILRSPGFYTSYAYLEARSKDAKIILGNGVHVNNNFSGVAHRAELHIGDDVLIGNNCSIITSDFHEIHPDNRKMTNDVQGLDVRIENNVFIGNNVQILKGVTIGENSVIGTGAVVSKSIPPNSVASGNPAIVIKNVGD